MHKMPQKGTMENRRNNAVLLWQGVFLYNTWLLAIEKSDKPFVNWY